jgi:glutathione S-transferase
MPLRFFDVRATKDSMMKLYDMVKAPNPRRVRMFLAEKGISIERVEIDIPSGQNLSPEFLAINPRGLLPTLVLDNGTVLDESIAICRYFEELHPEPNLMGRFPLEKAQIEAWQRRMELDGFWSIAMVFRNVSPTFVNRPVPGSAPSLPQLPAMAERGAILTTHFFEQLNSRLGESDFVAGDRFTIADITGFLAVEFARWVKLYPAENHAATKAWYDGIKARPSAWA